ncbi:hypothetical protein V1477_013532 [Vespula maculifrons]|uniref:Uncharacterized protein n=1 Tax=Vespula maculifrons TaxID=7453 RepID=A0ABD2BQH0_VESMC
MSWARGCGLLCGFPPFSIEKSSSIFVPRFWSNANTGRTGRTLTPLSAGRDVVFAGANKSPTDMDSSYRGLRFIERRLFDHAGHANFTVESPLARGSPDAATSKRWDLGRGSTTGRMAAYYS